MSTMTHVHVVVDFYVDLVVDLTWTTRWTWSTFVDLDDPRDAYSPSNLRISAIGFPP
jgi:hypothetical protein